MFFFFTEALAADTVWAHNYFGCRRFAKSHEWLDFDTETKQGKLGITKYAADALGDIVHVDLPGEGDSFSAGESIVSTQAYFKMVG